MEKIEKIKSMKGKEKIAVLTCYDYSFAKMMDGNVDILLVGDSLGMVVLGYDSTKKVSMQDMLIHTEAVARAAKQSLIVADLPYMSDKNPDEAVKNAKLLLRAGANAVKPEGKEEIVKALTAQGIAVMGHIGLLPQTAEKYSVQGKDEKQAQALLEQAKALEKAGAFAIVIECVPSELAKKITESISIPTIGIGAGPYCDGQVLVNYDMLGLYENIKPKFVREYADLKNTIKDAVVKYADDVKKGNYPSKEESYE